MYVLLRAVSRFAAADRRYRRDGGIRIAISMQPILRPRRVPANIVERLQCSHRRP